jgi:mannose-6-phosphate isomerase
MTEKLPRKIEKPWGFELLFAQTPQYAGKLIFVKKGHRLSLQYHEKKDETMYLFQGEALLEIEVGKSPPPHQTPPQGY